MAAALSNELGMMENQLSRSKHAASEALALREQAESLASLVAKKVYIRSCQAFLLHLYFLYSAYSCFVPLIMPVNVVLKLTLWKFTSHVLNIHVYFFHSVPFHPKI